MKINIKPISVNEAWQGRRFKTEKYKGFQTELLLKLPNIKKPFPDKLYVIIKYGFSSKLSDIDNPCKMVLDCLSKKYGFDDRNIYKLDQEKEIVTKGKEYIKINIKQYEGSQV